MNIYEENASLRSDLERSRVLAERLQQEVERMRAERDEARATKDMHKERQEQEIELRQQAEARLGELVAVVEALEECGCHGTLCPHDRAIRAAAQPEKEPNASER